MLNHFRKRKVRRLSIEIAFNNVQVWCCLAKEIVGLAVGDVA